MVHLDVILVPQRPLMVRVVQRNSGPPSAAVTLPSVSLIPQMS